MTLRRAKNHVIYLVVVALVRVLSLLPCRVTLGLGPALGLVGWLLGGRERRRALLNLERGGVGRYSSERGRVVRRMFWHLGQSAMECVVMPEVRKTLGTDQSPVRFEQRSRETLLAAAAQGRGVLYVTAHLGNWELMAAEVARWVPVSVLFKPSYDPRFTRLIEDFRQQNGVRGISVTEEGHLRKVLGSLRRGEVVGVLLDQPVPTGCQVTFFDHPAWTSEIVARLQKHTGAPVVVGTIRRDPSRQLCHEISICSISIDKKWTAQGVTQELTTCLEQAVRRAPDQWAWSLDRWRSAEKVVLSSPNANCIPSSNN